jgi:Carboxypeptidase regulatory-like domain/TonB-dependent Receptor Plug Domain
MPSYKLLTATFALTVLCSALLVSAQVLTATLAGSVTDASGALIVNAVVTISQNGVNGVPRVVHTDARGNYTATNLAAGNYRITFTSDGFKTYTAQSVILNVAQTRSLDVKLEAGSLSETITVQQNSVSLDTTTSEQAGTISGTQVRELELNNRNFEELVTLQPGVVSGLPDEVGFGLNNVTTVSVNGARSTANNWTIDGASINDSGSNNVILNVPSIDAIQEFTLERSTYDAGYGRSGGGQVLAATKSGTSEFHGDVYEFGRNTLFNANSYFGNQAGIPRGVEHYNNYGFTLGGPLYIPKVYNTGKNKTFFFWSEEWRKVSSPSTVSLPAATTDQLNGIVSGQVNGAPEGCVTYDASSDKSTISSTCYSKNSKVYLTNIFDKFPNNSGGNYVATYTSLNNFRQDLVRLDEDINPNLHFFARAMEDTIPQSFSQGLFVSSNYPGLADTLVEQPGKNVVGNLTWTISPRMVNEVEFAYTQGETKADFVSGALANSSTVAGALTNNTAYLDPYGRIPAISFTSGTIAGYNPGDAPYHDHTLDRTLFDNYSLTLGQHTVRAGASLSFMLQTENASQGYASFNFGTWQDFLLGNASTYTQPSRDIYPDLHYYNAEAYVQDDWRLSKRLTLNLGLRYSYFPSPTDVSNTLNNFDPSLYNPTKAPEIDPGSGDFAAGQGVTPSTYVNGIIFPTGTACTQAKSIAQGVTCSPYGARVNAGTNRNFGPRIGFAFAPAATNRIAVRGGYGIFYDRTLNGIWEQNAFTDPPLVQTATFNNTQFDNPIAGTVGSSLGPNGIHSTGDPTFKVPSYMAYNLSVQGEVMESTKVELAYVGSLGRNLIGELDINQPTIAARQANPTANVNAVRPYAGYSYFQEIIPAFSSNYNSLQLSLNHRNNRGLTLGVAYTWSKNLTNQSTDRGTASTNTYSPGLDYGPSSLNQPQVFVANYVYELPFYKGDHGFAGHLLGGWQVSGITQFESGTSLTATQANDPFACITPSSAAGGCVAGTYPGGLGIADPNNHIAPRPDQVVPVRLMKKQAEWFSTNSFAPAVGHFGSERNGSFLGPGLQNWDLGVMKQINFERRFMFQLRGEFFNAFNHANFNQVDSGINDPSYGQLTGTHLPRNIQLAGKLYF